jgi:hypothetical protein
VREALALRRGLGLVSHPRPEDRARDRDREHARAELEKAFAEDPDRLLALPRTRQEWERLTEHGATLWRQRVEPANDDDA